MSILTDLADCLLHDPVAVDYAARFLRQRARRAERDLRTMLRRRFPELPPEMVEHAIRDAQRFGRPLASHVKRCAVSELR